MMYNDFKIYIYGILNLYGDNIVKFVNGSAKKLMDIKNSGSNKEMMKLDTKSILKYPNRFFLILYNYNGNKIWCPVYIMEYKVIKNKPILYALQLEYLPPKYKMNLFSIIFNDSTIKKIIDDNSDSKNPTEESGLPLNSNYLYNILKNNNNMNFALTGFDMSKIEQSYIISTKILVDILMADMKLYNSKNMKELYDNMKKTGTIDGSDNKLLEIIKQFEKIIEEYEHDSIEYHKNLKYFEQKLKIFKD